MRRAVALSVWAAAAGLLSLGCTAAAAADGTEPPRPPVAMGPIRLPAATLRTGEHPGFGRVVLDLPPGVDVEVTRSGADWRLRTVPSVPISNEGGRLRNLLALPVAGDTAVLTAVAGATIRRLRLAGRAVFDVVDPPPSPAVADRPAPAERRARQVPTVPRAEPKRAAMELVPKQQVPVSASVPMPAVPVPVTTETLADPASAPAVVPAVPSMPVAEVPSPAAVAVPSGPRGPVALAVTLHRGAEGWELSTPFGPAVGVAALRRGAAGVVVFDERRPIDLAAVAGDPALAGSTVQVLETATVLRIRLAATQELHLEPQESGWLIAVRDMTDHPASPRLRAIRPDFAQGQLHLRAEATGRVVTVPDPQSGGTLLVGTQRVAGEGVSVMRRVPDLRLLPTWQGVAVEPVSDGLTMRASATEFVVAAEEPGRRLAASDSDADVQAAADAATFTRRFDFPPLGVDALTSRLHDRVAAAAATPLQSRAARRTEAASTMLALGLPAEAGALLGVAATDDPRVVDDPQAIGLAAIAALLDGREAEAAGIDDPRLSGTDDVALWRAVRRARVREGAPEAAAVFAADMPLILAYPEPLRRRLLPLAAETMALGGEADAAGHLIDAQPEALGLRLAHAMVLQNAAPPLGDPPAALALYDMLSQDSDRLVRARATRLGIELRLARHEIAPAQAAERMERAIDGWRGDARELEVRMRTAGLQRQAGNWRAALASLRETEQLWPDRAAMVHAELAATFAAALLSETEHPLPPLDLVALANENADLVPEGTAGLELARRLADRLLALDLPKRAIPVFEKLVATLPDSAARASLGLSLGRLRLEGGDAAGALAALAGSRADGLPAALSAERAMLAARATMAQGDIAASIAILADFDTPETNSFRASIYEQSGDWPAAEAALRQVVAQAVPAEGALDGAAGQSLVRLASAAARTGDEAVLAALRAQYLARLPPGDAAKVFALLTEPPVQAMADLPRARSEAQGARELPAELAKAVPPLPREARLR